MEGMRSVHRHHAVLRGQAAPLRTSGVLLAVVLMLCLAAAWGTEAYGRHDHAAGTREPDHCRSCLVTGTPNELAPESPQGLLADLAPTGPAPVVFVATPIGASALDVPSPRAPPLV
jgi:hypothetical protein